LATTYPASSSTTIFRRKDRHPIAKKVASIIYILGTVTPTSIALTDWSTRMRKAKVLPLVCVTFFHRESLKRLIYPRYVLQRTSIICTTFVSLSLCSPYNNLMAVPPEKDINTKIVRSIFLDLGFPSLTFSVGQNA
jgi:hypothetical protein